MDWNRIEGNWKEVKGEIKEKWGKITDDDLTGITVDVINSNGDSNSVMDSPRIRLGSTWIPGS